MAELPPVKLGAVILAGLAAAFAIRGPLRRSLVDRATVFEQPTRQFLLDLGLALAGTAVVGTVLVTGYGFPPFSGVKLAAGMASLGFFLAMDAALDRQRRILLVPPTPGGFLPHGHIHPMSRKFALVALGSIALGAALLAVVMINAVDWLAGHSRDPEALAQARNAAIWDVAFVTAALLAAGGYLVARYARNLRLLLENQAGILAAVSAGDLSRTIPVVTADEFGLIAGRTNAMIEALRHRSRLMEALRLAETVQKSLLPSALPDMPEAEFAATAVYSGHIGGDYYDFLELTGGKLAVVVADVSGHGLDSALLMASARGFLRQAALCLTDISRIVTTLNRHLARDVAGSGHFITLFLLVLDPRAGRLEWIRAGHDAALLYDPATGAFEELAGRGLPLAVDEETPYLVQWRDGWPAGQALILGTDGLWETFGPDRTMYGKARLKDVIRRNGRKSARDILEAILDDWRGFRGQAPQQDDLTLVVVTFPEA